jgi:hypothetical protein
MTVEGVSNSVAVKPANVVVDSAIVGNFDGWDGDTMFDLANGQVWQQSQPGIATAVAVRPRALIYGSIGSYKMQVEGVDGNVGVERLR